MTTEITYGIFPSPFGSIMIGKTRGGICWIGFGQTESLRRMKAFWRGAVFIKNSKALEQEAREITDFWSGKGKKSIDLPIDVIGTDFQADVWRALCDIPVGETRTYGEIAAAVGRPRAVRAVGSAVGKNPVSLVIPCHRVVHSSGGMMKYGWGPALKKKILAAETALV